MSQELGERATQERCEARTLSALLHLFQTPRPQRKKRGGEDEDVLAEDPEDLCPRSLGSAAPTGHDDAAPLWVDDDCLSPMTPGPPPKIEFFVTPKPLYQNPLYHPGVVSLFHHRTNPWVQQVRRPSSLDLWEVPGDEAAGEVPQELEAEVPQDAETGKDGAGDDIVEVIVIEDDETTGEAVQDTEVEMGGTAGGVAEVTLIEDETTGDGQQRPESNETTGQGPLCPENDEITNTVPQRPESDETTNRGRQCPEVREDGITCQTTERPEAKTGGPKLVLVSHSYGLLLISAALRMSRLPATWMFRRDPRSPHEEHVVCIDERRKTYVLENTPLLFGRGDEMSLPTSSDRIARSSRDMLMDAPPIVSGNHIQMPKENSRPD